MGAFARAIEVEVNKRGGEIEDCRESAFLFRDPGDGFGGNGVQREEKARRPGGGAEAQLTHDCNQQQGRGCVQHHVHQMIAEDCIAPQTVLDPEC